MSWEINVNLDKMVWGDNRTQLYYQSASTKGKLLDARERVLLSKDPIDDEALIKLYEDQMQLTQEIEELYNDTVSMIMRVATVSFNGEPVTDADTIPKNVIDSVMEQINEAKEEASDPND